MKRQGLGRCLPGGRKRIGWTGSITQGGPPAFLEPLEPRLLLAAADLTFAGAVEALNGAVFRQWDWQAAGTGLICPFVRVQETGPQADGVEAGYNTDGTLEFDTQPGIWTHSLLLSEVPVVNLAGRLYREFGLDINETGDTPLLSLDELKIYLGSAGDSTNYATWGTDPYKVFDLDEELVGGVWTPLAEDNWVKLDYALNPGSGGADMIVYVPDVLFTGAGTYVYLYSKFGAQGIIASGDDSGDWRCDDGFEEWFVGQEGVPLSPVGQIHGYKFNDNDGEGDDDGGYGVMPDLPLAGWKIYIDADDDGMWDADEAFQITSPSTAADWGQYHFTNLVAGLGEYSLFRVREVVEVGWTQTTPGVDEPDIQLEKVDISTNPNKPLYVGAIYVAFDGQAGYWATDPRVRIEPKLAFGNQEDVIRTGKIDIYGLKYEDRNRNGEYDDGEGLADWTILLYRDANQNGLPEEDELWDTFVTGPAMNSFPAGTYIFTDLPYSLGEPYDYLVREVVKPGWTPVAPYPPAAVTGEAGKHLVFMPWLSFAPVEEYQEARVHADLAIGNILTGRNARTLGFWSNKNGQALITNSDLAVLNTLYLVDNKGASFTFDLTKPLSTNLTKLRNWLLVGKATNMSYMLSVQLAAMQLNLLHSDETGVTADALLLVTNPDGTTREVTVAALIDEAKTALASYPLVPALHPQRSYLESLKNALDDGNNNLNWLS